jgi:hypothetical protein
MLKKFSKALRLRQSRITTQNDLKIIKPIVPGTGKILRRERAFMKEFLYNI